MDLLPLLIIIVGFAVVVPVMVGELKKRDRAWRAVADRHGLAMDGGSWLQSPSLAGEVDGVRIELDSYTTGGKNNRKTYTRARARAGLPPNLSFKPEHLGTGFIKLFAGPDVEVGDEAFDDAVHIKGSQATVLALMDQSTRAWLMEELEDNRLRIEDGVVRWEQSGVHKQVETMSAGLLRAADVARRLSADPRTVPDRLAQRVASDAYEGVRALALRLLIERHRDSEACERALKHAESDESPRVRRYLLEARGLSVEAGGLALAPDAGPTGGLSLAAASSPEGALSEVEPAPARQPKKQRQ